MIGHRRAIFCISIPSFSNQPSNLAVMQFRISTQNQDHYLWILTLQFMDTNLPEEKTTAISMDQIIAAIRSTRDQQIDELMKDPVLMAFLEHYYNTIAISDIKKEFLRRDLIELKKSPLDLSYYSSLITKMKESNTSKVDNHKLFLAELKTLLQKQGL